MIIEKASDKELELLADANFRHPENIRTSLDHDAIAHILKRHGVNSVNVRNGEIPITYEDIANYRYIVNNADAILRTLDKYDQEAITAFKQVNGYAVVVEQAINKKNELVVKHPTAKAIGLPRLMLPIGKVWFSLCVPNHRDFTELELQRIPYRSHTSYFQRRNFAYFLR
ncbi:hypothetical protein HpBGD112_15180 [Helicobacter pylori]